MFKLFCAALAAGTIAGGASSAATLLIDDSGMLTGAKGIVVEGTLYDVSFVDGSCTEVFDGCDEQSDFDFEDQTMGVAAAQALLDQVIVNTAEGAFSDMPALTSGCQFSSWCTLHIPILRVQSGVNNDWALQNAAAVNNAAGNPDDYVAISSFFLPRDFTSGSADAWADFSVSTPAVPVPAGLLLLGSGLAGLTLLRRRRP